MNGKTRPRHNNKKCTYYFVILRRKKILTSRYGVCFSLERAWVYKCYIGKEKEKKNRNVKNAPNERYVGGGHVGTTRCTHIYFTPVINIPDRHITLLLYYIILLLVGFYSGNNPVLLFFEHFKTKTKTYLQVFFFFLHSERRVMNVFLFAVVFPP